MLCETKHLKTWNTQLQKFNGGGGCMCAQIGDINHVLSRDSFQKLLKKSRKHCTVGMNNVPFWVVITIRL